MVQCSHWIAFCELSLHELLLELFNALKVKHLLCLLKQLHAWFSSSYTNTPTCLRNNEKKIDCYILFPSFRFCTQNLCEIKILSSYFLYCLWLFGKKGLSKTQRIYLKSTNKISMKWVTVIMSDLQYTLLHYSQPWWLTFAGAQVSNLDCERWQTVSVN